MKRGHIDKTTIAATTAICCYVVACFPAQMGMKVSAAATIDFIFALVKQKMLLPVTLVHAHYSLATA